MGIELRSEFFAHQLGGKAAVRGDEPLFGWLRLSVVRLPEGAKPTRCGFALRIVQRNPASGRQPETDLPAQGWQMMTAKGNIKLGIVSGDHLRLSCTPVEDEGTSSPIS